MVDVEFHSIHIRGVLSGNLLQFAIENGPVETASVPINSMVMFESFLSTFTRG